MIVRTYADRVCSWYNRGYCALVNCIKADKNLLPPIRKILRENGIEYHNVSNSAGYSIYIRQEDDKRASDLTARLPKSWYEKMKREEG